MSNSFSVTARTKLKRRPERGSYDRALAYRILDEALVCSVGFLVAGEPHVLPMAFARLDDQLLLHGASSGRLLSTLCAGSRICVTVTLVDGIVLARSAMHHSLNYRSVFVLGVPSEIIEPEQKLRAMARLVDHVLPGRSAATRAPNSLEMRATRVLALPIEEASVKCRSGGPIDDAADLELPFWAGQIPLTPSAASPIADAAHPPRGALPEGARDYRRGDAAKAAGGKPQEIVA